MFVEVTRFPDGAGRSRHEDVRVGDGVRGPVGGWSLRKFINQILGGRQVLNYSLGRQVSNLVGLS